MPKVNSTIKKILKEKDAGILNGTAAMTSILGDLQKQVQAELGRAALGSWDAYQLRRMLDAIERQFGDYSSITKKEMSKNLDTAWELGEAMVEAPLKTAGEIWMGFNVSKSSIEVLALKNFGENITQKMFGDAYLKIRGEITLGVLGGKTPAEVATAIGKDLKGKSIFSSIAARAEAITKTEMGRVFSAATQARLEEAAQYIPDLKKKWIHAGHPKVARISHKLVAAQDPIPWDEKFLVGSTLMKHPRDSSAPISEVINCGCDCVPWHESWQ